jgi:hypothetical protein
MSDLLEVIAENDASVLNGWAVAMKERAPQIESLPAEARRRELLTLAREFTRRVSWAADTAEGWLTELKTRLREGMGGDRTRALLKSGRELCGMCRTVAEIAGDLWKLATTAAAPDAAVRTAEAILSTAGQRLTAVECEIESIAKACRPLSPEELVKFFQRAEEQPRQGKGLTREQALAAIRKAD